MTKLAPIILFVYKRPELTKQVLESLSKDNLAKESELYIFSDGPKRETDEEGVEKVRTYLAEGLEEDGLLTRSFARVELRKAEKNRGLANSIISGVTEIVEKYGKIIVLEDDLVFDQGYLEYMNGALDFYQDNPKIFSITGYSDSMLSLKLYPHDVWMGYRGCSWGWGTWVDRWKQVDFSLPDFQRRNQDKNWIKKFNRGGGDMIGMLRMQQEGILDSWAIRWNVAQTDADQITVFPKHSYIHNEGNDGTGTNEGTGKITNMAFVDKRHECHFENLDINPILAKEYYLLKTDTLLKKIKRNLKVLLIDRRLPDCFKR